MRGRGVLALAGLVLLLALAVWWVGRSGLDSAGLAPELRANSGTASATTGIESPPELAGAVDVASSRAAPALPDSAAAGSVDARGETAVLRVLVTAKEDGRPLEHIHVSAWRDNGRVLASGQDLETDGEGMTDLQVPSGIELVLSARGEGARAGTATLPVVPLAPGERREIALAVASEPDLVFCGRILDRESKDPVANAVIVPVDAREGSQQESVRSRPDGSFQIVLRSWLAKALQIDAPTHGRAFVRIVPGHETPGRALEILLDRAASITARVLRADGSGIPERDVTLSGQVYDLVRPAGAWIDGVWNTSWESSSGADGTAHFPSLTSNASLRLAVLERSEEIWTLAQAIVLAPGEAREVVCLLESGARIVGRAREADGKPAQGVEIWLAPARSTATEFFGTIDASVARRTRCDELGSFRFDAVPPGTWSVGPGLSQARNPAEDPAPAAQHVSITPETGEVEVEIGIERGLVITGRVVDPAGRPAASAWIQAWLTGTAQHMDAHAGPGGEFVLGPLVIGEWELRASGAGSAIGSDAQTVPAGTRDVVLALVSGGTLRVQVRDAQGGPVAGAKVSAMSRGPGGMRGVVTGPDGLAVFESLPPGTWMAAATTGDGRIAVREGLEPSSSAGSTIDLVLEAGARVRVKFAGPTAHGYLFVLRGETGYDIQIIAAGQTIEITAPIGRSTLRMHTDPGGSKDRDVDLREGATPEYVFDGGWQ